jgi:hypothetical protein
MTITSIFERAGLHLTDVEKLTTHGGSLRVYASHEEDRTAVRSDNVDRLLEEERSAGLATLDTYSSFERRVRECKRLLLKLLIELKESGHSICGYGAPGKGNTLLNYCGIRSDFLDFTVDRNPYKQGKFLPGTHIPILAPERLDCARPDYVFILPWNLRDEIMNQLDHVREWGGKFIIPIPVPTVFP